MTNNTCVCGSTDHVEADHCKTCGLPPENDVTHECPPGFLTPAPTQSEASEPAEAEKCPKCGVMKHTKCDGYCDGFHHGEAMMKDCRPASQQAPADLVSEAKEWLEANTPLKWVAEPDPECLDEPLESLNARQQRWANRLAAFAQLKLQQATSPDAVIDERVKLLEEALGAMIIAFGDRGNEPADITEGTRDSKRSATNSATLLRSSPDTSNAPTI